MSFNRKLFWEKIDENNRAMRNLARRGARKLKNNLNEMQARDSGDLIDYVATRTRKRDGEISLIKWRTKRYGFIIEHGSGRGWRKGQKIHQNKSVRPRVPKPWISNAMDDIVPDAANTIAKLKAEDMVEHFDKTMTSIIGQAHYRGG